ncbi:hypothetical protein TSOC_013656, partial [Tetrabaena socialis]
VLIKIDITTISSRFVEYVFQELRCADKTSSVFNLLRVEQLLRNNISNARLQVGCGLRIPDSKGSAIRGEDSKYEVKVLKGTHEEVAKQVHMEYPSRERLPVIITDSGMEVKRVLEEDIGPVTGGTLRPRSLWEIVCEQVTGVPYGPNRMHLLGTVEAPRSGTVAGTEQELEAPEEPEETEEEDEGELEGDSDESALDSDDREIEAASTGSDAEYARACGLVLIGGGSTAVSTDIDSAGDGDAGGSGGSGAYGGGSGANDGGSGAYGGGPPVGGPAAQSSVVPAVPGPTGRNSGGGQVGGKRALSALERMLPLMYEIVRRINGRVPRVGRDRQANRLHAVDMREAAFNMTREDQDHLSGDDHVAVMEEDVSGRTAGVVRIALVEGLLRPSGKGKRAMVFTQRLARDEAKGQLHLRLLETLPA